MAAGVNTFLANKRKAARNNRSAAIVAGIFLKILVCG